ncbi:hypothetical protein OIU84_028125 [Salix udensis]|uniref:Uncharacterized protein n=1 Tax=Salix udensis TaxID=889485 RepID=A0AAD6KDH6_9ROSI|nr:hypothetical protein OIU84_028125 [Salix udensis]
MRMKPEDFTVVPEWIPFPSLVAHRPDRAAVMFHNMNSPDASGKLTDHRFAVRSCRKFEGAYVDLLEELYQKPVSPVGLLPWNPVIKLRARIFEATVTNCSRKSSSSSDLDSLDATIYIDKLGVDLPLTFALIYAFKNFFLEQLSVY